LPDRFEEGMAAGLDDARGVQDAEQAVFVRVGDERRERYAVAGCPPARGRCGGRGSERCFLCLAILLRHMSRDAARGCARSIGGERQWTEREQCERYPVPAKAACRYFRSRTSHEYRTASVRRR